MSWYDLTSSRRIVFVGGLTATITSFILWQALLHAQSSLLTGAGIGYSVILLPAIGSLIVIITALAAIVVRRVLVYSSKVHLSKRCLIVGQFQMWKQIGL